MVPFIRRIEKKHIGWLINALVFSFFITVLTFKKGYSYAPMALAIIGVIYLFYYLFVEKRKLNPTREDKWLIFAFVFYFSTFALSAVIHGDGWREIDNPSRVLLFLPLLLLFREFPINIKIILYGIPLGSAIAGIVAIYHKFYLNLERPFPYLMHIQAGDIAISLAMMSLAISIYWGIKKNYKWLVFCLIASGFGVLASALTGARGGWVGLPVVLGIILWFSYKNLNKKITIGISLTLGILITTVVIVPKTNVMQRINKTHKEITNYVEKNHRHTSLGARFDMWKGASLGIKERPILGWGSKGYIELKKQQIHNKVIHKATLQFNDAHNQYLDSFVKKGIFGLLSILTIIFTPLVFLYQRYKSQSIEEKTLGLIGIIHIISCALFFTSQTFLAHNSGSIFYFFILFILPKKSNTK